MERKNGETAERELKATKCPDLLFLNNTGFSREILLLS